MATPFGPYQLLRRIASGGMGEVYLAVLERPGGFAKTVALKTILPQLAERPDFATRFESESATAALLNHPNIVQVFDHGRIEGRSYLTMEYVEGPDLARLIAACAPEPFPPAVAVELGVQLCRALGHAHARLDLEGRPVGIVHGDVSPSNVLLSTDGAAKLVDFGLARLVAATGDERAVAGKLAYMSPEQAKGQPLTPASDLFSLGLVLFELLTGQRAFPTSTGPSEVLVAIRSGQCPKLEEAAGANLPVALCRAIDHALRVDPRARPDKAATLAAELTAACPPAGPEALAAFVADRLPGQDCGPGLRPEPTEVADRPISPVDACPDPQTAASHRPARHWRLGLIGLVVITWGSGFAWWAFHPPPQPRPNPPADKAPVAPVGLEAKVVAPEAGPPSGPGDGGPAADRPDQTSLVTPARDRRPPRVIKRPGPPPDAVLVPVPREPRLGVSLPKAFTAQVDHRRVAEREVTLSVERAHLIQLTASGSNQAEVKLRLQPPTDGRGQWRLSIRSTPWMRIRLAGRAVGQTPRAGLGLPPGDVRLELARDERRIQIGFQVPAAEQTP